MRDNAIKVIALRESNPRPKKLVDKDARGKAPRFLAGDAAFIYRDLTLPYGNPRCGQPFGVGQRSANPRFRALWEPVFRTRGCNFSEEFLSRTRSTGQPSARVQVVTSWPPQFGSFLTLLSLSLPPLLPLVARRFLIPRHDFARTHMRVRRIPRCVAISDLTADRVATNGSFREFRCAFSFSRGRENATRRILDFDFCSDTARFYADN